MIRVLINASSRYPVDRKGVRVLVRRILGDRKESKNIEVSILFCGDRKIKQLNKAYRKINKVTDVLSFPLEKSSFPDKVMRLGDIVIAYPQARIQAARYNIIVDKEINKLVEHGVMSLLGLHE